VEAAWKAEASALQDLGRVAGLSLDSGEAQAVERAAADLRGRVEDLDLRLLAALADESLGRLAGVPTTFRSRFQEGLALQQGVQTPERLEKYPERALSIYNRLAAELAASSQDTGRMAEEIALEPGYLEASPPLRERAQRLEELRQSMAGLQAEITTAAASAEGEALQAGRYRQEGQLRISEVERSLNPLREAAARESLRIAQEALDQSLAFQEDPEVRRLRDQKLTELAKRIDQLVTERVIREVRELINNGKRLYSLGDYNSAEQVFVSADSRWKVVILEPNREIEDWLALTRNAIQNIAGREIAYSNPLYPQMSQLYNLAFREYQNGKSFVEQRRVQEALVLFSKAVERLDQIRTLSPTTARPRS